MKRLTAWLVPLMILAMTLSTGIAHGQDIPQGFCRIEGGNLVFRIDLGLTADQLKVLSGQFDLDTTLLAGILKGKADSLLIAGGWKMKRVSGTLIEISKPIAPERNGDLAPPGVPPSLNQLFLMDDSWLKGPDWPEPEPADYGVNRLTDTAAFSYTGSVARFFLPGHTEARQVFLSGSFNDWSTMLTPMTANGRGWEVSLPLQPGKYEYKFIVDGRWMRDPANREKEDDLNGGYNSVIYCYNYRFTLKGHADARKVVLAGSFNGFNPNQLVMNKVPGGWELPLYLRPGTHAYKFVIDGNWITDPANPVVRPDGRGNLNSSIGIGDTTVFRLKGFGDARKIILAGNFNAWNTAELAMQKTAGGWELPYVLAPGNYEYKYIVDGRWMPDPDNPYTVGEGDYVNSFLSVSPNHTFVLTGFPDARQVSVSGSFNGWNRSGFRMARSEDGWKLPLHLNPGKVTYKFIVDGAWILDPGNELWEENEYGTGNSVLWIRR